MGNSPGVYTKLVDEAGGSQVPTMTVVGLVMLGPTNSFAKKVKYISGGSDELEETYGDAKVGYNNYVASKKIADSTTCQVYNIPTVETGILTPAKVSLTNAAQVALIEVSMKKPGTTGNGYSVLVTKATSATFSLSVLDSDGDVVEKIEGIAYNRYSNSFFERVVSEYVVMEKSAGYDTATDGVVSAGEYGMVGGTDLTITFEVADIVEAIKELTKYDSYQASIIAVPCHSHLPEVVTALNTYCPEDGVVKALIFPPREVVKATDVVEWTNGELKAGVV
jgi:hypothetical protein